MPGLLLFQVLTGVVLLALTVWQLATGLRWVKLGRGRMRIHKVSGYVLTGLGLVHGLTGLQIAFGIFG